MALYVVTGGVGFIGSNIVLRLLAEREGLIKFDVTDDIKALAGNLTQLHSVVSVQRNLIVTRKEMRTNQKAQLAERISQFLKEIEGLLG